MLATRAQNRLRAKLGLPQRSHHGRTPLPSGDCLPPDQQPMSLFTYPAGTDTTTYTDRTLPDRTTTVDSLPNRAAAEAVSGWLSTAKVGRSW